MSYESVSFRTKEGTYKKCSFQYLRETRKAHTGKELSPVAVSFVSCKDKEGSKEWITFNSAKEYYFYPFHGVRKVGLRSGAGWGWHFQLVPTPVLYYGWCVSYSSGCNLP